VGRRRGRAARLRSADERLAEGERLHVDLLGRAVPVVRTADGVRVVSKGKPGDPGQVERYLASKFKGRPEQARQATAELAAGYSPHELPWRGFPLYESFRPSVPAGERGWGAMGELDLGAIRALRP
jgi:hypothetical protein